MQFDLLRAFPYPVLRPSVDDYIDGDIQATVDFTQSGDGLTLTANISFALSVPEIVAEIEAGRAAYSVVFACRDTYFRKAVLSDVPTFSHSFPAGSIRGEVLIYPYVVARTNIASFTCKWINAEFGAGPFAFDEGAALALEVPQAIYVDRDAFKPISSAFQLVKSYDVPDNQWRVDPYGDKVIISVSPDTKAKIDLARNDSGKKAILLNSIYLGAVIQCVSLLKYEPDEVENYRWAHIFHKRCDDLSINLDHQSASFVAQELMKHPMKLIDAYFFKADL
ncbi:hypothetical protein [Mesorhizobium sp. M7A.F.Ca.US.008.03.1.1]|uniref:hypothetical protein n=1 Tax=Mesorhizobium sp. M7A.F.Ca.US.008.03.1.1 TaxID=2496742 RepID=UPI000FCABE6C|nr:hypothetical protein [Mesorhizobium sp. M7A.F.Ca.US.008.03.1.1]RUW58537.1 hypothetical protein EOA16_26870 [Mesorhizobium sp. M7A.F.Ca.US.008.03.1.1]